MENIFQKDLLEGRVVNVRVVTNPDKLVALQPAHRLPVSGVGPP